MDRKRAQVTFVCIYACMVFENISELKVFSKVKVVPKEGFVLNPPLTGGGGAERPPV